MSLVAPSIALDAFVRWTWQTSLYASVLIALTFAIQWALGEKLSPRWRYTLGLLIVLRLILPTVPAARFSIFNLSRLVQQAPAGPLPIEGQTVPQPQPRLPSDIRASELSGTGRDPWSLRVGWADAAKATWLAGWMGMLVILFRQHKRFSRRVKAGTVVGERRLLELLGGCQRLLSVRRTIEVASVPGLATPALFGWRKPRLLLPPELLGRLSDDELRMIFLHELAHLKRHDILLNWLIVLVRALHWFNPLVWLAMRRLRADRELVCDAIVLERLHPDVRRVYGNTLVKLLAGFSAPRFCPNLVPVINNKREIKRRVTMIAKFKSNGRLTVFASAAVALALCALTFTRAADKTRTRGEAAPTDPYFIQTESARAARIPTLKKKLEELEQRINQTQGELDQLRRELAVPSAIAAGRSETDFADETLRRLENERVSAEANYKGLAELLKNLKDLKARGSEHLRKSILTVHDDAPLAKLLQDLWSTETTLAKLKQSLGPENAEMMSIRAMQADLDSKVSQRIEGILSGLEARLAAAEAQRDGLLGMIQEAKIRDAEGAAKYRTYFRVKRDLENLQKVRDALYLKILEQEYGVEVP